MVVSANARVTDDVLAQADEAGIDVISLAFPEWDPVGEILHQTIEKDSTTSQMGARMEIYRRQRPGDPPTEESATTLFNGLFFDERKYDLSRVGRFKFNAKLGLDKDPERRTLDVDDFMHLARYLLRLHRDLGRVDDIDSLANRRVRTVGELMENQFRIGLVRMERAIKEKMSIHPDIDSAMPRDLVNSKPVMASVDEFFGSSQLSQFMDQTNPLSEVTHKRRLSALGPGGLSRERAGFEVRDVHSTHYGRICPIETPEGPNIGLISSLSCFARLNPMGYIESPYKKVEKGKVLEHVRITQVGDSGFRTRPGVIEEDFEKANATIRRADQDVEAWGEPYAFYLAAWEEENLNIAQANAQVDKKGKSGQRQGHRPFRRRVPGPRSRSGRLHRRVAAAGGVGGGVADPLPRARRRQPRADGLEHAAPGRAAGPSRGARGRYRHGVGGGRGLRCGGRLPARRASSTRWTASASSFGSRTTARVSSAPTSTS